MKRNNQGFTLIELMIVIAIIAIIAAIAVPNLLSSRLAANESNAISTLRNLASAQAQFQSTGSVDNDQDGTGEYGSFGEMAGLTNLNVRGNGPAITLDPPILASTFQNIDGTGRVNKSGFLFLLFLPDAGGVGQPEAANGGPAGGVDDDNCEIYWGCYAYPVDDGTTGNRAFFANQRGEIIQTKMAAVQYNINNDPVWNAALSNVNGDMSDPLGINGAAAGDGNTWTPVQ